MRYHKCVWKIIRMLRKAYSINRIWFVNPVVITITIIIAFSAMTLVDNITLIWIYISTKAFSSWEWSLFLFFDRTRGLPLISVYTFIQTIRTLSLLYFNMLFDIASYSSITNRCLSGYTTWPQLRRNARRPSPGLPRYLQ